MGQSVELEPKGLVLHCAPFLLVANPDLSSPLNVIGVGWDHVKVTHSLVHIDQVMLEKQTNDLGMEIPNLGMIVFMNFLASLV